MERLNFNHLYYFYIVANEGSIKEAAEKLHVSQPTISDQIKLLEAYFSAQLFERKNRRLFLTTEGQTALKYAEKIFALAKDVTTDLRHQVNSPKKTLDIGISLFMSHYFIYDAILPLLNHREVTLNIQEADRRHLIADLENGRLDMIFTDTRESIGANMSAYRVGYNRTFAVAHRSFKFKRTNFPQGLENIPFFNYTSDSFLKYEIDLFFSKNNIAPRVIGEADDIDLLQLVTEKGLAFTIVPEVAQKRICRNKDIVVLGELKELQTSLWGIILTRYKGLGYELLKGKL